MYLSGHRGQYAVALFHGQWGGHDVSIDSYLKRGKKAGVAGHTHTVGAGPWFWMVSGNWAQDQGVGDMSHHITSFELWRNSQKRW